MSEHTETYEVTEDGKVFSISSNWRGYGKREMNQIENVYGYMFVRLTLNGKRVAKRVHVLVAEKYHGKKTSNTLQVRHLDGNKKNNNYKNLCWGTAKENANDRSNHGQTSNGDKHAQAIKNGIPNAIKKNEIILIMKLHNEGRSQRNIAKTIGRSQRGVGHIIGGNK